MLTPSNQYLQAVEEINDYVNQAKCRASVSVNSEIMKTNISRRIYMVSGKNFGT